MFESPSRVASSNTFETQHAYQVLLRSRLTASLPISLQPRPSPSTAHPDRWVTIELSVFTYGPPLVGRLLCRGRLALSRIHPASSTEGRRSRQSARPLQRAVHPACTTGPRFSWQDAATTRTGLEESLLRRVTVAASINPLEPCSRWVSANSPSTRKFPLTLAPSQCSF